MLAMLNIRVRVRFPYGPFDGPAGAAADHTMERIIEIQKMELPKPRFYVASTGGAEFWDIVDRETKQVVDYTRQSEDPTGERAQQIAYQRNNDPFELSA